MNIVVFWTSSQESFFDLEYNINCPINDYVACFNVDRWFDISKIMDVELVSVGSGIRISKPIYLKKKLIGGNRMFSSISHNGVLAIYCYKLKDKVQLMDLSDGNEVRFQVEGVTHIGFFDDSLMLLTYDNALRVCLVDHMLAKGDVGVLREVSDVKVQPWADVTLLHSTRTLIFASISGDIYEFDVDTRALRELDVGMGFYSSASLTGINAGVKSVFVGGEYDHYTYSLDNHNSTSLLMAFDPGCSICTVIPSSNNPTNLRRSMKVYSDGSFLSDTIGETDLVNPFKYQWYQSIVRLYHDIFLAFDANQNKWCLIRVVVP